jgi:tRNA threonylcarbamoyladenosine biosynthesis protein TsaB
MSNTTHEGACVSHSDEQQEARAIPLTLSVDTATDVRSVGVARGGRVIAKTGGASARGQSSVLLSEIDAALCAAKVSLSEIELFGVAVGPGSFTGLRAGLATIKAFGVIHDRPIAAVPTLHAVALSAGASARTVALIPAGRGEVFAQFLCVGVDGRIEELTAPAHVSPASLLRQAVGWSGELRWVGGGAQAHSDLIREASAETGIKFFEGVSAEGCASRADAGGEARVWSLSSVAEDYVAEISRLSLISYLDGTTMRPQDLRALYVRPSDAELNEQCQR